MLAILVVSAFIRAEVFGDYIKFESKSVTDLNYEVESIHGFEDLEWKMRLQKDGKDTLQEFNFAKYSTINEDLQHAQIKFPINDVAEIQGHSLSLQFTNTKTKQTQQSQFILIDENPVPDQTNAKTQQSHAATNNNVLVDDNDPTSIQSEQEAKDLATTESQKIEQNHSQDVSHANPIEPSAELVQETHSETQEESPANSQDSLETETQNDERNTPKDALTVQDDKEEAERPAAAILDATGIKAALEESANDDDDNQPRKSPVHQETNVAKSDVESKEEITDSKKLHSRLVAILVVVAVLCTGIFVACLYKNMKQEAHPSELADLIDINL